MMDGGAALRCEPHSPTISTDALSEVLSFSRSASGDISTIAADDGRTDVDLPRTDRRHRLGAAALELLSGLWVGKIDDSYLIQKQGDGSWTCTRCGPQCPRPRSSAIRYDEQRRRIIFAGVYALDPAQLVEDQSKIAWRSENGQTCIWRRPKKVDITSNGKDSMPPDSMAQVGNDLIDASDQASGRSNGSRVYDRDMMLYARCCLPRESSTNSEFSLPVCAAASEVLSALEARRCSAAGVRVMDKIRAARCSVLSRFARNGQVDAPRPFVLRADAPEFTPAASQVNKSGVPVAHMNSACNEDVGISSLAQHSDAHLACEGSRSSSASTQVEALATNIRHRGTAGVSTRQQEKPPPQNSTCEADLCEPLRGGIARAQLAEALSSGLVVRIRLSARCLLLVIVVVAALLVVAMFNTLQDKRDSHIQAVPALGFAPRSRVQPQMR